MKKLSLLSLLLTVSVFAVESRDLAFTTQPFGPATAVTVGAFLVLRRPGVVLVHLGGDHRSLDPPLHAELPQQP